MQVYLALSDDDDDFVLAQKQEFCNFWGGKIVNKKSLVHQAGQWCFPGGKIDASDKSPVAAALREFREETGVSTDKWDQYCTAYDIKDGSQKILCKLVHCKLPASKGFNVTTILHEIENNVSDGGGKPRGGHVKDWELKHVTMAPRSKISLYLGVPSAVSASARTEIGKLPKGDYTQAIDWYGAMARFLANR